MEATDETPAILLLDRDTDVVSVARRVARPECELHIASTIDLALRIVERRPVAVAVLDVTMAGLQPLDTVAKLRAHRPGLRVIFLALPTLALDRKYSQLGPVLRKPLAEERFAEVLKNALRMEGMSAGIRRLRESESKLPARRSSIPAPPLEADELAPTSRPG